MGIKNYENKLYKDYEELLLKFEEQKILIKETNKIVKNLNHTIETLNETIEKQNKIIEEQAKEILRMKSKNDRDSSNSSKPSRLLQLMFFRITSFPLFYKDFFMSSFLHFCVVHCGAM